MTVKKTLSYALVISIFGFLLWNIFTSWQTISSFSWRFKPQDAFLLLAVLVPIYLINAYAWHLVTRAIGGKVSFAKNLKVWMLSNLGRFLPGGFWQYAGRVHLLSKEGPSKTVAAAAVFVEGFFNLSVGALLALFFLTSLQLSVEGEGLRWILLIFVFLPLAFAVLSSERVATTLVHFLQKFTGRGNVLKTVRLPFRWVPFLGAAFFFQYFFAGTALFLLTRGAVDISFSLLPVFIGIFAASWLLGYITLFAPGGLGVQEASIAILLSPYIPFPVASILAVLFRILLLVSEVLVLLFVFWRLGKKP